MALRYQQRVEWADKIPTLQEALETVARNANQCGDAMAGKIVQELIEEAA